MTKRRTRRVRDEWSALVAETTASGCSMSAYARDAASEQELRCLLEACALCNDADLRAPEGASAAHTPLGLDETAQFINVLLGDMSIVGPRPLTQQDLTRFSLRACRTGGRTQLQEGRRERGAEK